MQRDQPRWCLRPIRIQRHLEAWRGGCSLLGGEAKLGRARRLLSPVGSRTPRWNPVVSFAFGFQRKEYFLQNFKSVGKVSVKLEVNSLSVPLLAELNI